jgi:hypothetical protein
MFTQLSIETWVQVGNLLTHEDQAALALTCKAALSYFGRNSLYQLSLDEETRLSFLFRLADEFPHHYLCGKCVKYHLNATEYEDYKPRDLMLFPGKTVDFASAMTFMSGCRQKKESPGTIAEFLQSEQIDTKRITRTNGVMHDEDTLLVSVLEVWPITVRFQQCPLQSLSLNLCNHLRQATPLKHAIRDAMRSMPMPTPWYSR